MITLKIVLLYFLIVAYLYFIYSHCQKDKYIGLTSVRSTIQDFYFIVITPLKPLVSKYKIFEKNISLPNFFIYKPSELSDIGNQGDCGACWAFVITSMFTDIIKIHIPNFKNILDVQQLLSCYKDKDSCNVGATPEDVLIWLGKTNFEIGIGNRYVGKVLNCKKVGEGIQIVDNSIYSLCKYIDKECVNPQELSVVDQEKLTNNIYNMKMQIKTTGPIFAGMSVYNDFFKYEGDSIYIKKSDEFKGGHAVEIIGWVDKGVDTRPGFKEYGYWICKNSWGTQWAPKSKYKGYFMIRMGTNECFIESLCGCATPNIDMTKLNETEMEQKIYGNFKDFLKI